MRATTSNRSPSGLTVGNHQVHEAVVLAERQRELLTFVVRPQESEMVGIHPSGAPRRRPDRTATSE
jgi:hypothetical protein